MCHVCFCMIQIALSGLTDCTDQFICCTHFHKFNLPSNVFVDLQSGCCKPSNDCNFIYVSPTVWNKNSTVSSNPDCSTWNNDPTVLCFSCESCKAGLLDNLKSNWKKVAVLNVIFLVFLIIVYSVGCCAFRNNRKDGAYWSRQQRLRDYYVECVEWLARWAASYYVFCFL